MKKVPSIIQNLMEELERLPGIGPKSAARLAYHMINMNEKRLENLAQIIAVIKSKITPCPICGYLDDTSPCSICTDQDRNRKTLCVVEDSLDLVAFERIGEYDGLYHVLGGVINPVGGIGPEDLNLNSLFKRLKENNIDELIISTNPSIEGEATAMYIKNEIADIGIDVKITRLARGLPTGADLDYADQTTLKRAFEGRVIM